MTRQQIYRRRRATVGLVAALLLGAGVYVPSALLAPVPAATMQLHPRAVAAAAPAAVALPTYGASAVGAAAHGGVLARAGDERALPIASIAKVVTALVVLDAQPLSVGEQGPTITTTQQDVDFYRAQLAQNGSVKAVRPGLGFTQLELLQLMLIVSANNYSETLAAWAFGSLDAYVTAAQAWLAENELDGITIVDATGIGAGNTATASALVPLAELAMQHPVVAAIVGTESGVMHDIGPMKNTNPVLGDPGVTGLKTGTLLDFGHNLLFSARLEVGSGVDVVGVVLGAPDSARLADAVRSALETARAGFTVAALAALGEVFGEIRTPWGESAALVAAEPASALVWSDHPVSTLVSTEPVTRADAGDRIGTATFVVGSTTVEVPLVLDTAIDGPDPWWRLTNPLAVF